jgi:bile acid:Na+ symporter, BASS family
VVIDLLNKVATAALLGFVVSSMMAMGVGFTVRQIIDALRDVRLVLLALLANFVAMPLGALALDKILRLDEPLGVGLLLLGAAAGAPFLPKLTELAKGNLPFAVGIMALWQSAPSVTCPWSCRCWSRGSPSIQRRSPAGWNLALPRRRTPARARP